MHCIFTKNSLLPRFSKLPKICFQGRHSPIFAEQTHHVWKCVIGNLYMNHCCRDSCVTLLHCRGVKGTQVLLINWSQYRHKRSRDIWWSFGWNVRCFHIRSQISTILTVFCIRVLVVLLFCDGLAASRYFPSVWWNLPAVLSVCDCPAALTRTK